ncbi:hypothetical protein ACNKHL_06250 [Shigella flexneri]
MQLLPYMLQTGILILLCGTVLLGSAGFWTALMGFLHLLIGRDNSSISASTVGDEPLNPEHRTALIMPICNEGGDRAFAGLRAPWESVKGMGMPNTLMSTFLVTVITRISASQSKKPDGAYR